MTELKEFNYWLQDFEKTFGITAYNEIKNKLTSLLQENNEIRKSRDNWRKKYEELKR